MTLKIGTRGSDLALWQARHVAEKLGAHGVETEIVVLKTRGDLIDDVPLVNVEGKAFFTAEIERALLAREVDLAVHSLKDLPTEETAGLVIAAVPPRAALHERLLVAPQAFDASAAFLQVRFGARVGTSAPRRAEQILALRPDLSVLDLRGNVPTRVRKLREGSYDAIVLAAAGLDRLQLATDGLHAIDLGIATFVPAPGQGALAVQVRSEDSELRELCRRALHDEETARAVAAERTLLTGAGGGCSLPLGAAVQRARDGASWIAHGFLGAGHPPIASHSRWARAVKKTPQAAIENVLAQLRAGSATRTGPLGGLRIALSGSAQDGSALGERLLELGADVVQERVIELENLPGVDLAGFLAHAREGDVIAVTSRHAARLLAGARLARGVRFAAVGRASARELAVSGFEATWVGTGGARELAERIDVGSRRLVLWPCAEEALPDLEQALRARGMAVERLAVYRTLKRHDVALDPAVDVRVYMSPSSVEAALTWERAHPARRTVRYALGVSTAAAMDAAGLLSIAPSCRSSSITEALVRELARLPRSAELA